MELGNYINTHLQGSKAFALELFCCVEDKQMIKVIYDEDYLQHHGIKGQEWGVRNGPPYPLDSKTQKKVRKQVLRAAGHSPFIRGSQRDELASNQYIKNAYKTHKAEFEELQKVDEEKSKAWKQFIENANKKLEDTEACTAIYLKKFPDQKEFLEIDPGEHYQSVHNDALDHPSDYGIKGIDKYKESLDRYRDMSSKLYGQITKDILGDIGDQSIGKISEQNYAKAESLVRAGLWELDFRRKERSKGRNPKDTTVHYVSL